jgi:hypothetical protein
MGREHRLSVPLDERAQELLEEIRGGLSQGDICPNATAILRDALRRGLNDIAKQLPTVRKRA